MPRILLRESLTLENVPQVPAAIPTENFDSVAIGIRLAANGTRNLVVKTRPTALAVELVVGVIQRSIALAADIGSRLLVVGVFANKGSFRSLLQDDILLLGRQFVVLLRRALAFHFRLSRFKIEL